MVEKETWTEYSANRLHIKCYIGNSNVYLLFGVFNSFEMTRTENFSQVGSSVLGRYVYVTSKYQTHEGGHTFKTNRIFKEMMFIHLH